MNRSSAIPWIVGGVCAIVLLYLGSFAYRFADERLYADSGYYLFWTINDGGFRIEHGRWVLALAEWPALLASLFGFEMPALILSHSFANVLFTGLSSLFAGLVLKDERTVLALCAAQLIGLTHGLFCPVFELYYGFALILLLHATLTNERLNGRIRLLLAISLLILALSSHPMAWPLLLGMPFLLDRRDRRAFLVPVTLVTIGFALLRWHSMSVYESAQLGFANRLLSFAPVRLMMPWKLWEELQRALRHYPDVLALAVSGAAILSVEKRWRLLLVHLTGIAALYIAVGLYLPDAPHDRYREQVDFGFSAWTMLVLFAVVWPTRSWRPLLLTLVVLGIGYRIAEAERMSPYYSARTDWLRGLVAEGRAVPSHRAIIDPNGISFGTVNERVAPYWSPGVETLLLSAREGPENTASVITTDDLECPGVPENLDELVLRCWDVLPTTRLNARLFQMPQGEYVHISLE